MALFVLGKGFRVVTTDQGARVVNAQGQEVQLTALEVQILARAAANGLEHSSPNVPAVMKKLAGLGVLQEVPSVAAAAEADFEIVEEPSTLTLRDVPPRFRTELKVSPRQGGQVNVSDPKSGKTFTLYDFEISLARMLDGRRTVAQVIEGGHRLGIPVDLASVNQFIRQLDRYGFVAPPNQPQETHERPPREEWDEGVRALFQTGLRLSRQGRYAEAVGYFEAMLQQHPENPQAAEMLEEAKLRAASAPSSSAAVDEAQRAIAEAAAAAEPQFDAITFLSDKPETPRRPKVALIAAAAGGVLLLIAGIVAYMMQGQPAAPTPALVTAPPPKKPDPVPVAITEVDPAGTAIEVKATVSPLETAVDAGVDAGVAAAAAPPDAGTPVAAPVDAGPVPTVAVAAVEPKPTVAFVDAGAANATVAPSSVAAATATPQATAGDDADWPFTAEIDKRGRVKMGEVLAEGRGTLKRLAAEEERVKRKQPVGELVNGSGKPKLTAAVAGLVFWQVDEGAAVTEQQLLANLLYHEAYVMAFAPPGPIAKGWRCQLDDTSTGQSTTCVVTGVQPRGKRNYVTVTAEPTWVERTKTPRLRLGPP